MPAERSDAELEPLFHRARELAGAERETFLATLADRPALLGRLRRLLAADQEPTRVALRGNALGEPRAEERIGRYRLLKVLGEGGMGIVYLAEQEEPVRRLVALKRLRLGLHSADVAARFRAESQALAHINHPGIAQIYDGGASESGLPYFVMEYVPGPPIDQHCDRRRASVDERLQLFALVCAAVQHAHQKGVLHRDLKPSNVLVLEQDGRAQPKIIDFGIARALSGDLAGESLAVAAVQVVGTHTFMSPEQARGEDLDTRTDVHALGVLLYELLTGVAPHDIEALADLEPSEAIRRVIEEAPLVPSARLLALGERAQPLAAARGCDARALVRRLSGDLDWIVARAMAKDRNLRYASASELAADVERHLRSEPVSAAPPSRAYRLGKFARRHRWEVAAAGGLALLLVGATIAMSLLLVRARRGEEEARLLADRAAYQAEKAHGIADFLERAIEERSLASETGRELTVAELFRDPLGDLDTRYPGRPAVEAGVLTALARMLLDLGDERALALLQRAELLQQGRGEPDAFDRFETLDALIQAERRVGDPRSAEPFVPRTLAAAREVLVDLDPVEGRALEALLRYQAGADVPGTDVLAGLEVLLAKLPEAVGGRDPLLHGIGRVAIEVGVQMMEHDAPELGEYLERLERKATELLGAQSLDYARFLWAVTRQLFAPGRKLGPVASDHARRLGEVCARLPEDHWLRLEAESLLAAQAQ